MLRGVTNTSLPHTALRMPLRVESPSGVAREVFQQAELFGGQFHFAALAEKPAGFEIQLVRAEAAYALTETAPPPQERIDARHQFLAPERLGDVIVGSQVQPQHHVLFLTLGGQHDDGRVERVLAHGAADFVAVDLGQHDVEQHQIGLGRERQSQPGFAVSGRKHFAALGGERVRQSAQEGRVVFDNQDAASVHAAAPFTALAAGRMTENVLPLPGWLSTSTEPPCPRTMKSTMLSPSPQPPDSRANRRSTW